MRLDDAKHSNRVCVRDRERETNKIMNVINVCGAKHRTKSEIEVCKGERVDRKEKKVC